MFPSSSDPDLAVRLAAGAAIVAAQAERLHALFGRVESEWKFDGSRVTAADLAISRDVQARVAAAFAGDDFCSEESDPHPRPRELRARFAWVLDPIDGTNNFALGLPHCAVSLALLEGGRPAYGWIYDMSRRRLLQGGPGFGAWDGDRAAQAATGPFDDQCLVGLHTPLEAHHGATAARFLAQFKLRALGSSTLHLAYVAVGVLDGVVDFNVRVWDIAAACALGAAAGVEIVFLSGDPFPLRTFDVAAARIHFVAASPGRVGELVRVARGE